MDKLGFDHAVLPVRDVERTLAFWERVCGAEVRDADAWRSGDREYPVLHFGTWKLNVHPLHTSARPRANAPAAGALDICLVWRGPIESAVDHLRTCGVEIETGPIPQEAAQGSGRSVYFRDPDGNLVEFVSYDESHGDR